jgi:hypothetical protein
MKRADVVIAGLVMLAVFGLVFVGQMGSSASFSSTGGDCVLVGSCTGQTASGTETHCKDPSIKPGACGGVPKVVHVECNCA